MKIYIFLTQITLVYSQWFVGEEKQQTTTSNHTEDASKPFPVVSPVECILECQKVLTYGYFVDTTKTCFCMKNKDQKIFSIEDENLNGTFYQQDQQGGVCPDIQRKSCRKVKEDCPTSPSGFYHIEIDGQIVKAFCDLEVEGGGWLGIANITFNNASLMQTYLGYVNNEAPVSDLQNIGDGKFMLDAQVVKRLFTEHGYTEVRGKCFKNWHGRTLHFILFGEETVKYMRKEEMTTHGSCQKARYLSDDTSYMARTDCSTIRIGYGLSHPYHYHLLWKAVTYQVMLDNRFACDDSHFSNAFTNTGYWLFFVR
ncbi:uncharacterized protein [Clytia hemisphaerica]|uniref:Fibrinogen C-terminal domain-containing protein n=1 Tax=Clytia hemisphaerica TaxID=252671 RepID=A0A7M5X2W9_9CNID